MDEIHRLNRQVEEVLYPAMEDYCIDIMIGKGPTARSIRLDLPKFTLVGATTPMRYAPPLPLSHRHILSVQNPAPASASGSRDAGFIAAEMGVNMKVTSGPAIEKPGEMAAILNNLQENDILFVDEIHRLNRQVEEVLYIFFQIFCCYDPLSHMSPLLCNPVLRFPACRYCGKTAQAAATPGIGKKTAEKLIIELKDKLDLDDMLHPAEEGIPAATADPGATSVQSEAVQVPWNAPA